MFRVENADFIADKLASELLPYQEFREVTKNAEEAIRRRLACDSRTDGRIVFDVDWSLLKEDVWGAFIRYSLPRDAAEPLGASPERGARPYI
jgi:hypothetical protein